MKSDKELADQLDAQDRLVNHGYTKEPCKNCDGIGHKITARHRRGLWLLRRSGIPLASADNEVGCSINTVLVVK